MTIDKNEVELLPLPDELRYRYGYMEQAEHDATVNNYARANVEHHTAALRAENETLKAELAKREAAHIGYAYISKTDALTLANEKHKHLPHVFPIYRDAAPAAGVPEGWAEAYRAFVGAFDTPTARMQDDSEYANDARDRLRALNDRFIAAAPTKEGD